MPSYDGTMTTPGEYDWTCASLGPPGHVLSLNNCPSHGGSGPPLIHVSLGPLESITKPHLDRSCRFCTAHGRKSIYFTMGTRFPQNCPLPIRDLDHHLISFTRFLRPIQIHNPNGISIGSAVFVQFTAECSYTLYFKIAPFRGGSRPHLIHGSLGPPESSTQTASRSVEPFLQD